MARDRRALRAARARARSSARREANALPKSFTARARALNEQHAKDVLSGKIPEPPKGSLEAKSLGRWGSYARWGKADKRYEDAFSKYWYHRKDEKNEADSEDESSSSPDESGEDS